MKKAWFHIFNINDMYNGIEPPFTDSANFSWTKEFEENSEKINQELQEYLKNHQLVGYFISSMVSKPNSWKTISIRTWGIEQFKNQKHFPITNSLIKKYPEIVSASFNLLEANSSIHPHCGDTNTIYRCHLGLDIPEGLPNCGFKVLNETREWKNGQWLIFMDSYVHEAFNNTTKNRFIFVLDVVRNEYKSEKNKICAIVRTSLFLQKRWQRNSFLKNLSPKKIKLITVVTRPFMQIAIRLTNLLKIY